MTSSEGRQSNGRASRSFFPGDPFCGHEWTVPRQRCGDESKINECREQARGHADRIRECGRGNASFQTTPHGNAGSQTAPRDGSDGGCMPKMAACMPQGRGMSNGGEKAVRPKPGQGYLFTDPFLTKYSENIDRPRIKVSVYHAKHLPDRGGRCQPYCTVHARGAPKTRISSQVDKYHWGNPIWNFENKAVFGWVPGMPLIFEVKNKAVQSGGKLAYVFACGEDETLGTAELDSSKFWPSKHYKGSLELSDKHGVAAGRVWIEVMGFGGPPADRGCCHAFAHSFCHALQEGGERLMKEIHKIPHYVAELKHEVFYLLGPEYIPRKEAEMWPLIFAPFLVFVIEYWLRCFLYHVSPTATWFLIALIICISIGITALGLTVMSRSKGLPWSVLGTFCLLAAIFGIIMGNSGWNYAWQQWWWMHTGVRYTGASATTPAAARVDASIVTFANGTEWTSVDAARGAGFRVNGQIYCVAPILDPSMYLATFTRVNYWAIGINCCDDFGSFTCDASRDRGGGVAVVMVDQGNDERGTPCAGCHSSYFNAAVLKTSGINKFVSAQEALFVRYVKKAWYITAEYTARGLWSMVGSFLLGFAIFALLGFLANYKGWGKPPKSFGGPADSDSRLHGRYHAHKGEECCRPVRIC